MRVLVQRVDSANVTIDNKIYSKIDKGLLLLVGFTQNDNYENIKKMIDKIINLRIFEDNDNKMNLSIQNINGEILSVSQFTLYANTKKGNRPSFIDALKYDEANELYNYFNDELKNKINNIKTGVFGADMKIELINNGPVTILLEE